MKFSKKLSSKLNKAKQITVWQVIKRIMIAFTAVAVLFVLGLFLLVHYPATQIPEYEPIDEVVYLDQGWGSSATAADRELYYYTGQGTNLKGFEYDWFVNLEMPWGKEKFATPEHLQAYGFIVDNKPSAKNPDLLPVGFTKHFEPITSTEVLDITCSACHNGQLNMTVGDKRYAVRIDGGQAMHAFTTMKIGHFVPTMIASMASTYLNPFKFKRFAKAVLKDKYSSTSKAKLKSQFGSVLWRFLKQGYNDSSKNLYPVEEGFGRTDALARIGNTVFGDNLDDKNYHVATGPVSYPPVWNIWRFDWVQYGASVAQPMARNMGEALGVGAHIAFNDIYGRPLPENERFSSSVMVDNIHAIETSLQKLKPPTWPEQLFGKIDQDKAVKGKALFQQHCQGCHGPFPASDALKNIDMPLKENADDLWIVKAIPVEDIGTDPKTAFNFVNNRFDLSKTGLNDDDIVKQVRPIHVKQLKRIADVVLQSPQLVEFLSQANPDQANLTTSTDWIKQNKQQFDKWAIALSNWQSSYTDLSSLTLQLSFIEDPAARQDVGNMLIKQQLDAVDALLNSITINALTVGEALNLVGIMVREKYYKDQGYSEEKQACMDGFGALDIPQQPLAYKARPLEGIWATPPFLHNGSVPNIYQLLSPVSERDTKFHVGRREYDPKTLGYVTRPLSATGFWFDTSIVGNTNTGHEFRAGYVPYKKGNPPQYGVIGPELSPEERWQIIEYLKIHKDAEYKPVSAPDCSSL